MLRGVRVVLFVFVNKKSNHYSEHVFQGSSSRCVVKFLGVITAYQVSLRRNSFSTAEVLGRCQNCLTWHSCTVCVFTLFVPLCCIVFTCQTHLCGTHPNRLPTASSTTNTGKCSENTFMLYNLSCLLLNTSANPLSSKFLRQSENCCLLRRKKGREKKKKGIPRQGQRFLCHPLFFGFAENKLSRRASTTLSYSHCTLIPV